MAPRILLAIWLLAGAAGCSGVIEPGHRGLLFDPHRGGLQREVLGPGAHPLGLYGRLDDFDVTFSTRAEPLHVVTVEGLAIDVRLSVIYRPIVAELYELDTEIGPSYYDEVVGPELRAGARACFAGHSYRDLMGPNQTLEDEIERGARARLAGKHVEVTAVTFEAVQLAPEIVAAVRAREVAEQDARRRKAELESKALQDKLESDQAWEREKRELQRNVERRRLQRAAE